MLDSNHTKYSWQAVFFPNEKSIIISFKTYEFSSYINVSQILIFMHFSFFFEKVVFFWDF